MEEHRMAVGHVRPHHEKQIGRVKILIGSRRAVGPEGQPITRTRTGHAQPGIGVDPAGSDKTLGQLVGQILGLK